jgi:hypothetical protein
MPRRSRQRAGARQLAVALGVAVFAIGAPGCGGGSGEPDSPSTATAERRGRTPSLQPGPVQFASKPIVYFGRAHDGRLHIEVYVRLYRDLPRWPSGQPRGRLTVAGLTSAAPILRLRTVRPCFNQGMTAHGPDSGELARPHSGQTVTVTLRVAGLTARSTAELKRFRGSGRVIGAGDYSALRC